MLKMFSIVLSIVFQLVFVCILSHNSNVQGYQKFYRKDYKYIEPLDSFYKIHRKHNTWEDAERICSDEEATLLYPKSGKEALEFVNLLSLLHATQPSVPVINGISNVINEGLDETFEGILITELYTEWGPSPCENNKYPFICKKSRESFEWNHECNVPISGYTYYEETGRCYKLYLQPKNWTDAADTCNREQSYLAVINSDSEAKVLIQIAESTPNEGITRDYISGFHLGFHKNNHDWVTLDEPGKKLQISGYVKWSAGQPDNAGQGELCGSMFYSGELNDISCHATCLFICEHEVESLSALRGYRLEAAKK